MLHRPPEGATCRCQHASRARGGRPRPQRAEGPASSQAGDPRRSTAASLRLRREVSSRLKPPREPHEVQPQVHPLEAHSSAGFTTFTERSDHRLPRGPRRPTPPAPGNHRLGCCLSGVAALDTPHGGATRSEGRSALSGTQQSRSPFSRRRSPFTHKPYFTCPFVNYGHLGYFHVSASTSGSDRKVCARAFTWNCR